MTADASGSHDPDGTIASYRFDFGDGTVVGPQSSPTATHTYAAGRWTATVVVTDAAGASGSASVVVTVTRANQPPVAKLTVTPSSGIAPLLVVADASGSYDPDGTIASYRFDFGDGTVVGPQTLPTATHIYAAGRWTATVVVKDAAGASGSASVVVTASSLLAGALHPDSTGGGTFQRGVDLRPRVTPNPVQSDARLVFATSEPGVLSIRILDPSGRQVRKLLDEVWAPAGGHFVPLDGRGDDGVPLRRGVYYFQIRSTQGVRTGRFVIVR